MKEIGCFGLSFVVLAVACGLGCGSSGDSGGGSGPSRLAFVTDRDGNFEIYVMNADGTNQTNLTNNGAFDYFPVWSPDGTKIAFETNRDGNLEIYVMNADGTNQTNLTNNVADDFLPVWSP